MGKGKKKQVGEAQAEGGGQKTPAAAAGGAPALSLEQNRELNKLFSLLEKALLSLSVDINCEKLEQCPLIRVREILQSSITVPLNHLIAHVEREPNPEITAYIIQEVWRIFSSVKFSLFKDNFDVFTVLAVTGNFAFLQSILLQLKSLGFGVDQLELIARKIPAGVLSYLFARNVDVRYSESAKSADDAAQASSADDAAQAKSADDAKHTPLQLLNKTDFELLLKVVMYYPGVGALMNRSVNNFFEHHGGAAACLTECLSSEIERLRFDGTVEKIKLIDFLLEQFTQPKGIVPTYFYVDILWYLFKNNAGLESALLVRFIQQVNLVYLQQFQGKKPGYELDPEMKGRFQQFYTELARLLVVAEQKADSGWCDAVFAGVEGLHPQSTQSIQILYNFLYSQDKHRISARLFFRLQRRLNIETGVGTLKPIDLPRLLLESQELLIPAAERMIQIVDAAASGKALAEHINEDNTLSEEVVKLFRDANIITAFRSCIQKIDPNTLFVLFRLFSRLSHVWHHKFEPSAVIEKIFEMLLSQCSTRQLNPITAACLDEDCIALQYFYEAKILDIPAMKDGKAAPSVVMTRFLNRENVSSVCHVALQHQLYPLLRAALDYAQTGQIDIAWSEDDKPVLRAAIGDAIAHKKSDIERFINLASPLLFDFYGELTFSQLQEVHEILMTKRLGVRVQDAIELLMMCLMNAYALEKVNVRDYLESMGNLLGCYDNEIFFKIIKDRKIIINRYLEEINRHRKPSPVEVIKQYFQRDKQAKGYIKNVTTHIKQLDNKIKPFERGAITEDQLKNLEKQSIEKENAHTNCLESVKAILSEAERVDAEARLTEAKGTLDSIKEQLSALREKLKLEAAPTPVDPVAPSADVAEQAGPAATADEPAQASAVEQFSDPAAAAAQSADAATSVTTVPPAQDEPTPADTPSSDLDREITSLQKRRERLEEECAEAERRAEAAINTLEARAQKKSAAALMRQRGYFAEAVQDKKKPDVTSDEAADKLRTA